MTQNIISVITIKLKYYCIHLYPFLQLKKYIISEIDFKNFDIADDYWYWAVTSEGLKLVVVFMYKDEMYQVFRRYNPRNTIPMNKLPKPTPKEENDGEEN